jgi:uncharacterized membrane protein YeiH
MPMTMIQLFNYAGIFVFAATGALAASRRQLDIIAFVFLAAVTGIGGGTLRDLILGVPVFWVQDPGNLLVCAAAAILVYSPPTCSSRATVCSCGSMRWGLRHIV